MPKTKNAPPHRPSCPRKPRPRNRRGGAGNPRRHHQETPQTVDGIPDPLVAEREVRRETRTTSKSSVAPPPALCHTNTVKTFPSRCACWPRPRTTCWTRTTSPANARCTTTARAGANAGSMNSRKGDTLLDDIEAMLAINREQLGYIPEERGRRRHRPARGDSTSDPATGKPIRRSTALKLGSGRLEHPVARRASNVSKPVKRNSSSPSKPASLFPTLGATIATTSGPSAS